MIKIHGLVIGLFTSPIAVAVLYLIALGGSPQETPETPKIVVPGTVPQETPKIVVPGTAPQETHKVVAPTAVAVLAGAGAPQETPKVVVPGEKPVVEPRQPMEKLQVDSPAETRGQAAMPVNFIRNRVDTIKSGNTAFITLDAVKCDSKRYCWVNPHAITGVKTKDRPVEVKRDEVGFHVVFENIEHQWEAVDFENKSWLPIKTLSVRPNREDR